MYVVGLREIYFSFSFYLIGSIIIWVRYQCNMDNDLQYSFIIKLQEQL